MSLLQSNIEVEELVRVREPKVVIFTFFGTLTPPTWESDCFDAYVKGHLREYLVHNWRDQRVYRLMQLLAQISFDQRVVFEKPNVPLVMAFDLSNSNWLAVVESVDNYVLWQANQGKLSPESRCLTNLCLADGYKQRQVTTVLYDDVEPTLRHCRSLNIRIVVFSGIEAELCRLCMTCTNFGDLSALIDCYCEEARIEAQTFDRIANQQQCAKPEMLFVCEHGQNVRMAHGNEVQAVLIMRSDAKHIRTYYRLRFPATNTLKAIQFVRVDDKERRA